MLATSTRPSCPHPPVPDLLGQQLQAASGPGLLQLLTFPHRLLQPLQALGQGPIQLLLPALLLVPLTAPLLSLAAQGPQRFCGDSGICSLLFSVWGGGLRWMYMFLCLQRCVHRYTDTWLCGGVGRPKVNTVCHPQFLSTLSFETGRPGGQRAQGPYPHPCRAGVKGAPLSPVFGFLFL